MTHAEIAGYLQVAGLFAGGVFALMTYSRDARLRRSEWLYRLYQQFYENDRFKRIRRLIDFAPDEEIEKLAYQALNEIESDEHEALVDYLNFFEFIAVQVKNRNIRRDEVFDMFDYYIRLLGRHEFVMTYLDAYGYENLHALVLDLSREKTAG